MLREIPGDLLIELVNQKADWLLHFLKAETLFDVNRIGLMLTLGQRAVREELERRQREADETAGAPAVETAVEQVSPAAVFADMFDVGVMDLSELPAEQEWFDLSRAGGHELRAGIDQVREDDNHEWQTVYEVLDYVTVANARIHGYTQFRCPMENAPAYVLMDPEYPQGVERASFEEPVAEQEWFDLSPLDEHVLRTCDQFYGTTAEEWVQVGTVAGQTVSAMKAVGYLEFRCRIEDAPQPAAPPIPATLEPVVDARDPDDPNDWF